MVYYTIREEILFIALNYPRSFRAQKNTKKLENIRAYYIINLRKL